MRRGFTIIEIVVYSFLALLAAFVIFTLYTVGTRARQVSVSSYLVSVDTEAAIRWMRRDLQETALVSVRVFPNDAAPNEPPGCSFVSARDPGDLDEMKLNINPYGAPLWTKTVFYTLQKGARTGQLVRWEKPLDASQKDNVPRVSDTMPSAIPSDVKTKRVLMSDTLEPDVTITGLNGSPGWKTDKYGGLRVQFIRRQGGEGGDETLTSVSPADHDNGGDTANNTSLLSVELKVLASDTSRPSVYDIEYRVHPRY